MIAPGAKMAIYFKKKNAGLNRNSAEEWFWRSNGPSGLGPGRTGPHVWPVLSHSPWGEERRARGLKNWGPRPPRYPVPCVRGSTVPKTQQDPVGESRRRTAHGPEERRPINIWPSLSAVRRVAPFSASDVKAMSSERKSPCLSFCFIFVGSFNDFLAVTKIFYFWGHSIDRHAKFGRRNCLCLFHLLSLYSGGEEGWRRERMKGEERERAYCDRENSLLRVRSVEDSLVRR